MYKLFIFLIAFSILINAETRITSPTVDKKVNLTVKNVEKLYNSNNCVSNINIQLENKNQDYCKNDIIKLKVEVSFNKNIENINDTKIKCIGYKIEKISQWKKINPKTYECEIIISITDGDKDGKHYLFLNEFTEIVYGKRNTIKMNYAIFMLQEINKIVGK